MTTISTPSISSHYNTKALECSALRAVGGQRVHPMPPSVSSSDGGHMRSAVLEFASAVSHSWSLLTKLWSKSR